MRPMILSLTFVLALAMLSPLMVNHLTRKACAAHSGVRGVNDRDGQRYVLCRDGYSVTLGK